MEVVMTTKRKEMTTYELISIWFQSIALIIAALWGYYTFYFEKVKTPKTAPVNVSLKIELKQPEKDKTGTERTRKLLPIEMNVSATNPSSRTIYFLPNAWVV